MNDQYTPHRETGVETKPTSEKTNEDPLKEKTLAVQEKIKQTKNDVLDFSTAIDAWDKELTTDNTPADAPETMQLHDLRQELQSADQEVAAYTSELHTIESEISAPEKPAMIEPPQLPIETQELPQISPEFQKSIEATIAEFSKQPGSRQERLSISNLTTAIFENRNEDPRPVFEYLNTKFTEQLRQQLTKQQEKNPQATLLDVLDSTNEIGDTNAHALSVIISRMHTFEDQGKSRPACVDANNEMLLSSLLTGLKNASGKEISDRISTRNLGDCIQTVVTDLQSRIASGEKLPPSLEKKYAEVLPLLEKSDSASSAFNAETDAIKGPEKYERDLHKGFLKGINRDRENLRGVVYNRLSKARVNETEYDDKVYAGYAALGEKYGITPPKKPEPPKPDVLSFDDLFG